MKFTLYALRWQASSLTLWPVIWWLSDSPLLAAVVGNALGACVFYWVDRQIFERRRQA